MSTLEVIVLIASGIGALLGMAGTIIPLVPGLPLVFLSIFTAAAITHFARISATTIIVLGVVAVVSVFFDMILIGHGVRRMGGSRRAAIGAIIGSLLGLVIGSFPGFLIGMLGGAIVGELSGGGTPKGSLQADLPASLVTKSLRAGVGAVAGMLASSLLHFLVAATMLTIALIDFFRP